MVLGLLVQNVSAQVRINELCALNGNGLTDFQSQTEDWVELYNAGSVPLSLENYRLTDREDKTGFVFPVITLNPGQFLVVFLSGKNLQTPQLHTPFKIKEGETLYLFSAEDNLVDQLQAMPLHLDHSIGRQPDGTAGFKYFTSPSPGASNNVASAYAGYTAAPVFSRVSGFFHEPVTLQLSCSTPGAIIRYTTNGAVPGPGSAVWSSDRNLYAGTVVRAYAESPGLLPSGVVTHTYFQWADHDLPVINVVTDSVYLHDSITGLFWKGPLANPDPPFYGANFWSDTEYVARVQLFENEALVFSQDVGMSIHGGSINRSQTMKSLRLTARKKYGDGRIEHPFFPQRNQQSYKQLVLRNGSSDFCNAQMRDELVSDNLIHSTHNDVLANRPCIVYINGEYWGLYHMREKRGRHNLHDLHGVNADSLDILRDNLYAWKGDTIAFGQLHDYVMNHNLAEQNHFDAFAERMDMENFTDYFISEIFYGNTDWPYNNIEVWRERKAGSKFRYMLFDFDVAFIGAPWLQYNVNIWDKLLGPAGDGNYHVDLLEQSLTNAGYYRYFVNRYCDLLNTLFTPEHLVEVMNRHKTIIQGEIPRFFDRWGVPVAVWENEMDKVEYTSMYRPQTQTEQLRDALKPGNIVHIGLAAQPEKAGHTQLNTLRLTGEPWEGNYFDSVAISITAQPEPGYVFRAWKIEYNGQSGFYPHQQMDLLPQDGMYITAIYTNSETNQVTIFPNPASGSAIIRAFDLLEEDSRIEISDITGRIVYAAPVQVSAGMTDVRVNLESYGKGVYIARLFNGNQVLSAKFVCE